MHEHYNWTDEQAHIAFKNALDRDEYMAMNDAMEDWDENTRVKYGRHLMRRSARMGWAA